MTVTTKQTHSLTAHESDRLITTNDVRGRAWTFLRRRAGHRAAVGFLDAVLLLLDLELVRVGSAEADAGAWLRQRDDREFSWIDATSFATMRELKIVESLAFDGDFSAAGFTELRA